MDAIRIFNTLVLLACIAGGIYYITADNEIQGAVVVLLGILYFVGLRQVIRE